MRIVITGASGNAGTALLSRLVASGGHELVGVSRRRPPAVLPYDSAESLCVDLGADGARSALRPVLTGADAVVHVAGLIQPSRRPQDMHRVNQQGTGAVTDAAIAAGVLTVTRVRPAPIFQDALASPVVPAEPVIDRAAFRDVFGGVGPPVPPRVLRAAVFGRFIDASGRSAGRPCPLLFAGRRSAGSTS